MEVEFITGLELNQSTHTYNYNSYSKYCCIWFSDGGVAVIELSDYISLPNGELDDDAFKGIFSYRYSVRGKQVNSDKEEAPIWEIIGKDYSGFIDPRDNN